MEPTCRKSIKGSKQKNLCTEISEKDAISYEKRPLASLQQLHLERP
jgi:hypothetical protein